MTVAEIDHLLEKLEAERIRRVERLKKAIRHSLEYKSASSAVSVTMHQITLLTLKKLDIKKSGLTTSVDLS
jgi:hypothetical protein